MRPGLGSLTESDHPFKVIPRALNGSILLTKVNATLSLTSLHYDTNLSSRHVHVKKSRALNPKSCDSSRSGISNSTE